MSPTVIHLSSDSSLDESTSACGFSVSSKGTLVLFCVSGFPPGVPCAGRRSLTCGEAGFGKRFVLTFL